MQSTEQGGSNLRQHPNGAAVSSRTPAPSAEPSATHPSAATLANWEKKAPSSRPSAALLTPAQAAHEVFGISERSFHELRKQAWMPQPVVLGPRLVRFVRAELEAACAAMPRGTVAAPPQLEQGKRAKAQRAASAGQ